MKGQSVYFWDEMVGVAKGKRTAAHHPGWKSVHVETPELTTACRVGQ